MASKELLLKVARMSSEGQLTNEQIADALFAEKILKSRNTRQVRELLDEAVVYLLHQHEASEAAENDQKELRALEEKLCERYELLDARVVPGGDTRGASEYGALMRKYGREAAHYFDELSSEAEDDGQTLHVAVSGGQSILDMVSSLPERRRTCVHFYSAALIGRGGSKTSVHIGPVTNASVAWSRSGRIPQHLYYGTVQPYAFTDEELKGGLGKRERHNWVREEMARQMKRTAASEPVKETLRVMADHINMAIAGLGVVRPDATDTSYGSGHLERVTMTSLVKPLKIDLDLLAEEGACGEISYCMFDRHGKGNPRWNFFLTAGEGTPHSGVDFYRHLVDQGRKVIVIAGSRKWAALVPAINARLFNVLITDAHTATRLLIG